MPTKKSGGSKQGRKSATARATAKKRTSSRARRTSSSRNSGSKRATAVRSTRTASSKRTSRATASAKPSSGKTRAAMAGAGSHALIDHDEIRRWAEERSAKPAYVKGARKSGDVGLIRLDFPGYSGDDTLEEISWDEWFQKFDRNNLALLVQDKTADGQKSNFNKLVSRATVEERPLARAAR